MSPVPAALTGAVVAGVLGLLMPRLVSALPEPLLEDLPDDPLLDTAEQRILRREGPKEPYVAIAALPWLLPLCALGSAVLAGLVGWRLADAGEPWALLLWVPAVPLGLALAVVDARTRLLPKRLVTPAIGLAVVTAAAVALATGDTERLMRALLGLLVAFVLFFILHVLWSIGMGFGDVRLSALLGLLLGWLGWAELLVGLYAGFLVMGGYGLVKALAAWDRSVLKTQVPFGPFLLAGTWAAPFVAGPLARALGY